MLFLITGSIKGGENASCDGGVGRGSTHLVPMVGDLQSETRMWRAQVEPY
jgi:hypothetical protein